MGKKYAWLFYGAEGAGKTFMVSSVITNPITEELIRPNSLLLDTEGRFSHLGLPKSHVLSLLPAYNRPKEGIKKLGNFIIEHQKRRASTGENPLDVIAFDSITEYQNVLRTGLMKEAADAPDSKEDEDVSSQRTWGKVGDTLSRQMKYLHPDQTGAHFLATAYFTDNSESPKANNNRIVPALQGYMKDRLAKYFDFVVYVERTRQDAKEKTSPIVHRYHFHETARFVTKDVLEHKKFLPNHLDGSADKPLLFDHILEKIGER